MRQGKRRKPGWEYLHVCVDATSRGAYTGIHADETEKSAGKFLLFAVTLDKRSGIMERPVIADKGLVTNSRNYARLAANPVSRIKEQSRIIHIQKERQNGLSESH